MANILLLLTSQKSSLVKSLFLYASIWVVSINVGTPIAGWFIMDNSIKIDDLGVPIFQETSVWRPMCPNKTSLGRCDPSSMMQHMPRLW